MTGNFCSDDTEDFPKLAAYAVLVGVGTDLDSELSRVVPYSRVDDVIGWNLDNLGVESFIREHPNHIFKMIGIPKNREDDNDR